MPVQFDIQLCILTDNTCRFEMVSKWISVPKCNWYSFLLIDFPTAANRKSTEREQKKNTWIGCMPPYTNYANEKTVTETSIRTSCNCMYLYIEMVFLSQSICWRCGWSMYPFRCIVCVIHKATEKEEKTTKTKPNSISISLLPYIGRRCEVSMCWYDLHVVRLCLCECECEREYI